MAVVKPPCGCQWYVVCGGGAAPGAIAGQLPGNGNQGRVLPSNTRGITRYLVIPAFEVPDGQRQPRGHTTAAARVGVVDPIFCYAHCDRPRPTPARDEAPPRATVEWRLASRAPHLAHHAPRFSVYIF